MNENDGGAPGFPARLKRVVAAHGSATKLAGDAGLSEGVLRKWMRADSEPRLSDLVALAGASGYSLWWLITGKGAERAESPPVGEAAPAVDPDLLGAVMLDVDRVIAQLQVSLPPQKRAGLVSAAYELARESGRPSEAVIAQLVRLAQ